MAVVKFCHSIVVKSGVSALMFSIHCFPTIRSGVKDTEVSLPGLFKYSVGLALTANVHGHKYKINCQPLLLVIGQHRFLHNLCT